ncbi:MAG: S41 family peptidase [Alphaproteobacteria bacterium]
MSEGSTAMATAAQLGKGPQHLGLPLVLSLLLGLAACGQPADSSHGTFVAMAGQEFGAGFSEISKRYVEPVSIGELALAGMQRMESIDPKLKLTRNGGRLQLAYDNGKVVDFTAPRDDDPVAWAVTTSLVLDGVRELSQPVRDTDVETIYDTVFSGALKGLDPFSRYATAAAARDQRAQREGFGGIGLTIKQDGTDIRVVSVLEDGPSAKAGVAPDDLLVQINGLAVGDLSLDNVIDRLRGPVGSPVHVTFLAAKDRVPREVVLSRTLIVPPTVSYTRHGDIAAIRLTSFNSNTTASLEGVLRQAMGEMGGKLRGVVIDLRDNPGGLLDQAVSVSELFLKHGRILSTSGRHPDSNQIFDSEGHDLLHGLPMALLVNHGTASAAEVVAAALQDQGRAVVVGTASYGKGTVQTVHELPNSGELIITWSRIHAPSGYVLNEVGVIPNVCTSKVAFEGPEAVAQVLDTVKSGRLETSAARFSLHANGRPNKLETRLLRASCPARDGEGEVDLEVAQKLIEDRGLFARALQAPGPEIAKRQ